MPNNSSNVVPRYNVNFSRIMTPRFDIPGGIVIAQFGPAPKISGINYDKDIRKVFEDLMLKDILQEEDERAISAVVARVG